MHKKRNIFDKFGISSSLLCAIHCSVIPLFGLIGGTHSLHWLHNPVLEMIFVFAAIFFFSIAVRDNYRRGNLHIGFVFLGILGISLILVGHYFFHHIEWKFSVVGGSSLIIAHYLNIQKSKLKEVK